MADDYGYSDVPKDDPPRIVTLPRPYDRTFITRNKAGIIRGVWAVDETVIVDLVKYYIDPRAYQIREITRERARQLINKGMVTELRYLP
jgi:hypothetical protein